MNQATKTRLLHRLRIIRGHLKKIELMVDDDQYCVDVMTQLLAVSKSVRSAHRLILEQHLERCVVDQAKQGQTTKLVQELLHLRDLEQKA